MAAAIAHRGPDDEGLWSDPAAGIVLAHRRLSIVDLSPMGHQPMLTGSGRFVIAFNGEIYNHAAMRAELDASGAAIAWRGSSDTEVLVEALARWGVRATLERTVGMFAFALWDRADRVLTLARDRLGEKPLYYGWCKDTLLFGSELAALKQHPDFAAEIDRDALALMMRFNNVPAPHTIYRGIRKLEPATFLTLRAADRRGSSEAYWSAAGVAAAGLAHPFTGSAEDAEREAERLLRLSLAGQMQADVPLGAFLSGGIDSSTVVALMQDMSPRPVRTFTIGFHEAGYDEAADARRVARHLRTDHTELYLTEDDALSAIPKLAHIYSEPFADSSQIPTFLVAQMARRHVTVSLSGDGGDEVFSGYRRYRLAERIWPKLARLPAGLRRRVASAISARSPEELDRLVGPLLAILPAARRPKLAGEKLHKAAGILGLERGDAVYDRLVAHWDNAGEIVIGAKEGRAVRASADGDLVRNMMLADLRGYLPDDILVKVDRAAMAVGLETRVPLIDHRLVEFAWTLPLAILRRGGQSKWLLRRILAKYVPTELTSRPKMGFGVPIDSWLRGPLRDWAESLLDERRLAREGYFEAKPIRDAWQAHLTGRRNLQHELWCVLMFEAWLEAPDRA